MQMEQLDDQDVMYPYTVPATVQQRLNRERADVLDAALDKFRGARVEETSTMDRRSWLLRLHETLSDSARALMQNKNQHYATNTDPFRNFRQFGLLGIAVRLGDKLSRLQTFAEAQTQPVSDEAIEDTVLDTINYAVLYLALHRELSGLQG